VKLRKRGTLRGLVGLTTFSVEGYQMNQKGEFKPKGRHEITFYSSILDRLSEDAVVAVIAHELAHAWLNEHVAPEASKQREEDADLLAEMWGFRSELRALERETEPV
jgi:predicted SprT family Zn-dependent metalloprotease